MASYSAIEKAYLDKNKKIDDKTKVDEAAHAAKVKDLSDDTSSALQQIYIQNERARALQKQSQKAAGITGGAAESADIALQAAYATNRTNALLERDRQISQLEIEKNRSAAQAEIDKSNNLVEMEQGRLAFDQKEEDAALARDQYTLDAKGVELDERGAELDRERFELEKTASKRADEQFTYEKQQDREADLWEIIAGGVVTRSMAKELGVDYDVLKQLANNYKEKMLNG